MATVLQLRTDQIKEAETRIGELTTALQATDATLAAAGKERTKLIDKLTGLQVGYQVLQADLARPGQTAAVNDQIVQDQEDNLKEQRPIMAAIAARDDEIAGLEVARRRQEAALAGARAAQAAATAAEGVAEAEETVLGGWLDALTAPEAVAMLTAARTARDPGTAHEVVRDHLATALGGGDAAVGGDLLDGLTARAADATAGLDDLADRATRAAKAVIDQRRAQGPLAADTLVALAELAAVRDRIATLATDVLPRATAGLAWLEATAAVLTAPPPPAPPPDPDAGRIGARKDAAKTVMEAEEKDLLDARTAERAALTAFDPGFLAAIGADPAATEDTVAGFGPVQAARTATRTAATVLDGAKGPLDEWEVALPPRLVERLLAFLDADAALADAAAADVAVLVAEAVARDAAVAAALKAEDGFARAVRRLEAEAQERRDRLQIARVVRSARLAGAVRGDA